MFRLKVRSILPMDARQFNSLARYLQEELEERDLPALILASLLSSPWTWAYYGENRY